MSNVKHIDCGSVKIPFKLTKLAYQKFRDYVQKELKGDLSTIFETDGINASAILAMYSIEAGYRIENKELKDSEKVENKYTTIEKIFELDEQYNIIDLIFEEDAENQKKQMAS